MMCECSEILPSACRGQWVQKHEHVRCMWFWDKAQQHYNDTGKSRVVVYIKATVEG